MMLKSKLDDEGKPKTIYIKTPHRERKFLKSGFLFFILIKCNNIQLAVVSEGSERCFTPGRVIIKRRKIIRTPDFII